MVKSVLLFVLFACIGVHAQNLDSVLWYKKHIPSLKHDSLRIIPMVRMAGHYGANSDSAFYFIERAIDLAKRNKADRSWAFALSNRGGFYYKTGRYEEAIQDMQKAIEIYENLGRGNAYLGAMSNLAILYRRTGNLPKSLEINQVLLTHYKEIGDTVKTTTILNNLGNLYSDIGDQHASLSYHRQCLALRKHLNDKAGIVFTYSNIGNVYDNLKILDSALFYFHQSLKMVDAVKGTATEANVYNNIGVVYASLDSLQQAERFYLKALPLREEFGDFHGIAQIKMNLSGLYYKTNDFSRAVINGQQSFEISEKYGYLDEKNKAALQLSKVYEKTKDFSKAYHFLKIHIHMKDSLEKVNNKIEFARQEYAFVYEQQRLQDSLRVSSERQLEQVAFTEQKKRQQLYVWIGVISSLAMLIVLLVVYKEYKTKSRSNKIITYQKEAIEVKNREIVDSITYAKRIQNSILPPVSSIKLAFPDSFVLYIPKDVVSGDFYWYERVGDLVFIAAADCTGHGVPGAMVSVVCHQALHKALVEEGVHDVGKLLDRTRDLIVQQLQRSGEIINDGMDISLASLRFSGMDNSGTNITQLNWSGANNPLWILRCNNAKEPGFVEFKPDKQPIGKYDNSTPFTTHVVELKKGDCIYLFTDGLQDQFGGEKGKKFKPANLKKLLLENTEICMEDQKKVIERRLNDWMGSLDQVDDICMIGIRV